jgi:hypothetical protein
MQKRFTTAALSKLDRLIGEIKDATDDVWALLSPVLQAIAKADREAPTI